ncbi:MAG: AAA family ATPase [Lachnospiraceae bacterium]|nr:AAA family ATPase [Lachnospiraceae bacterium]
MWFNNIYFINGTAYAGKSTIVKLLTEKYGGIACEENYHDRLLPQLSKEEFPCLTYTRDLEDWHDFIRRTPAEYEAWFDGAAKECETLETIADHSHILIMLADPQTSVRRFFERPDREKQFLYQLIMEEPDPEYALNNFRQCLARINSQERYDRFLHSGFHVIRRDEDRSIEQTLAIAEKAFGLEH